MPLPVALTVTYLAVNLAMMVWLERGRAAGHPPSTRLAVLSAVARYGPPLLGLAYLLTIAGDWVFFLFVAVFFAASFWMMDGLLAINPTRTRPDTMHSGWDDRGRPNTDRDAG